MIYNKKLSKNKVFFTKKYDFNKYKRNNTCLMMKNGNIAPKYTAQYKNQTVSND